MNRYQPTPDDLALESLIDEACERFRYGKSATEKRQAVHEYRDLVAQRSVEFQTNTTARQVRAGVF